MQSSENRNEDVSALKSLGQSKTDYPTSYDPSVLESFDNHFPGQNYTVNLKCPEFTSMCPKTGQPDFANITIDYIPDQKLVESKSLKLYLFSFRNFGEFHEDCVNRIARDLNALLKPKWLRVHGDFMPRGGISINPTCEVDNRA